MKYILAFSLLLVATFTLAQSPAVPQATLSASTLSDLTGYTGSLLHAVWNDPNRGGPFDMVDATGLTVDNGIIISTGKAGKVWRRDLSQSDAINLKWYGATGDGITNIRQTLIDAITAANDSRLPVYFPKGDFLISYTTDTNAAIIDLSNITIAIKADNGARLIQGERHKLPMLRFTNSKVNIDGLEFVGVDNAATFTGIQDTGRAAIGLYGCDSAIIRNVNISGKAQGVITRFSDRCTFEDISIVGLFEGIPIAVTDAGNGRNYSSGFRCLGDSGDFFINCRARDVGSLITVGLEAKGGTIIGGSVKNAHDNGIYISSGNDWNISDFSAYNLHGSGVKVRGSRNSVSNCTVKLAAIGVSVTGNGTDVDVYGSNGWGNSATNNRLDSCIRDGINVGGQDGHFAFNIKIIGNTIRWFGIEGGGYAGIRGGGNYIEVKDNTFIGGTICDNAIVLSNFSDSAISDSIIGLNIIGNHFIDCKGGMTFSKMYNSTISNNDFADIYTNACIRFSSNCADNVVTGNITNIGVTPSVDISIASALGNIRNYFFGNKSDSVVMNKTENIYFNDSYAGQTSSILPIDSQYSKRRGMLYTVIGTGSNADASYIYQRSGTGAYVNKPVSQNINDVLNEGAIVTARSLQFQDNSLLFLNNTTTTSTQYKINGTLAFLFGLNDLTSRRFAFKTYNYLGAPVFTWYYDTTGHVGFNVTNPSAQANFSAGSATAKSAPIKFTSGTLMTTPESGAVEYDGTDAYITTTGGRFVSLKGLKGSATLDFASTAAQTSSELTITVTGAADGDDVIVSPPNASSNANSAFTARVSAANTVSVKFNNYSSSAIDPASGTFKVTVIK